MNSLGETWVLTGLWQCDWAKQVHWMDRRGMLELKDRVGEDSPHLLLRLQPGSRVGAGLREWESREFV